MIDWLARANAKFVKTHGTDTVKTDESGVSSVSAVRPPCVSGNNGKGFVGFGSGSTGVFPEKALSDDVCGWPRDEQSGAAFCPWGPYVTPAMLNAWLHELHEVVAELAAVEGWTDERRMQIAHFVEHQPGLATLRDDISYFTERLSQAQRGVERPDAWRCERIDARLYCVGCDGSCVGQSKRCNGCA